ncbi:hypothetical protein [Hyphomonas johnsonii]|uniref:Glycerophosphoryl diester phosphodiesterase membrane domain-containing protein n=1 Tax=Hyphomonas johnsonii MHS-2 TaxID=1280950 RepID=A0A059F9E3_9PROT|nr:hypothetical protein [Hyphomonas johnsonii]KCZ87153.1 hypothetical protein HJO_17304 [Hyphomonas johnsonii MHS-2]
MPNLEFNFDNALFHFRRTGGPKGFLLKFGATYAVLYLVMSAVNLWLQWPMFGMMFNPDMMNDPVAMEAAMTGQVGRMLLGYLLMFPLGLAFWMLFEGANQRRYMRAEGFRLQLGGDEWRLLVVGLIWFGLFIALYLGIFLVMALIFGVVAAIGSSESAILAGFLVFILLIAYMVFALWVAARFSPAAALTVRDRSIQFGQAWRVTKGKAWAIVGSWIVLMLIMMVVFFVFYLIFAVVMVASLMPVMSGIEDDPTAIFSAMAAPGIIIPGGILMVGFIFLQACWMHIFSGPAALAARADPQWASNPAIDETFT